MYEAVLSYYSYQNLKAATPDLAALEVQPPKPEELILLDTLMALRVPFQEGGYIDQPWIIMQAIEMAASAQSAFSG